MILNNSNIISNLMRFKDVLTYDKDKLGISFNFKNLCKMRNVTTEDVSHIGKVIKYCCLGSRGIVNYKVPLTDLHVQINKKTGDVGVGKYETDDFTIGMCAVVPTSLVILAIAYRVPLKLYVMLGVAEWFLLQK